MSNESCVFCRIVRGEAAAAVVFEDDFSLAFLDNRPLFIGHTLLIPKQHCITMIDLPAAQVGELFTKARLLMQAVERGLAADGVFVAVNHRVSQTVPHLHIHIVPRRWHDGLKGFFWPRQHDPDPADMMKARDAIREAIAHLRQV